MQRRIPGIRQSGYALLLMMLGLMGLGGVVATGFTQQAKVDTDAARYAHNQRVLKEAKQALLLYAYNYPNLVADRGPGRLPCPDTDNDGIPENVANCGGAATPDVGRFPWNTPGLNFYDIRDASNERLWYAVSSNFDYADADPINAGTDGTITIHDRNNLLLHDGSLDGSLNDDPRLPEGIVAVIIAPGGPVPRGGVIQNRNVTNGDIKDDQVADTDPGIVAASNYLDVFAGRDNIDFVNRSAADGFIQGPIYSSAGEVIVNDQMILITAEEITQLAQRAALEEYRARIDDWQEAVWPGLDPAPYPWLEQFDDIADLDIYHVTPNAGSDTAGRVPFLNFYADRDTHTLVTDMTIDYEITFDFVDTGIDGGAYLGAFDTIFGPQTLEIQDANLVFLQRDFAGANNVNDDDAATMAVSDDGVNTAVTSGGAVTTRLYFWDGCATCFEGQDGWELCANASSSEADCAMDNTTPRDTVAPFGINWIPFTGDWDDHADIRIRFVELELTLNPEFEIGFTPSDVEPGAITPPNGSLTAPNYISAKRLTSLTGATPAVTDLLVDEDDVAGDEEIEFINIVVNACEQDNNVGSNYNVPSFNPDGGSYDCGPDIDPDITVPNVVQFEVTADYFPELPVWVLENGWNNSILLAYAPDHAPEEGIDCDTTAPCLTVINDFDNTDTDNHVALLVGAGAHPENAGDLVSIYDDENDVPGEEAGAGVNVNYDANPMAQSPSNPDAGAPLVINGDDTLLILEEN